MSRVRIPVGPRVSGWLVIAASVLAITGLTQCRFEPSSSITGLEVAPRGLSASSDCIRGCDDALKAGREAETERHRLALQACGSDADCKRAESELHVANLRGLIEEMRACKNACYNEGGGDGGR